MMMKYKRYLLTGGPVPRSTAYNRKKKQQQVAALQKARAENAQEVHSNGSENEPTIHNASLGGLVDSTLNAGDTSTDEEVGSRDQSHVRRKKQKQKTKGKHQCDQPKPVSSSDRTASSDCSDSESGQPDVSTDPQSNVPREVFRLEASDILDGDNSDDCQEQIPTDCDRDFEPLCPCTSTTVDELLFMTLTLGLRHGLSWAAQVDILKMMRSIFGDKKIPLSKSKYLQKFNSAKSTDIQYNVYCDDCHAYVGKKESCEWYCSACKNVFKVDEAIDTQIFENCDECHIPLVQRVLKIKEKSCHQCKKLIKVDVAANLFVSLSIESQLQKFVQDEKFVSNVMQYRFNRQSVQGVYSDICDGEMYQKHTEDNGILLSPYNFSYTFFTDGVAFGKSSNKTIWPIYLTINELPYEERSRYFILAGVYAGPKDPNQKWFFQPFINEANKLSEKGFQWVHEGKSVTSLVIPLCFVADSVARYQMLNRQAFHACYGCTFCYHQSVKERGGQRFLLNLSEEPAPDRTDESYNYDLSEVVKRRHKTQDSDRSFRGVKGPCQLGDLKYFSVVNSCVVDYMHCILGVVKKHMELIFDPCRKKMWINMSDNIGMGHLIAAIDEIIGQIQSNTSVIRELRLLKDIALWKASEFRSWLLFYCIVCLKGFLKEKYLVHLALLSKATNLLLQKTVTHYHIECALKLFKTYTFFFQKYFGEENMVYNVHLLSHIPAGVLKFGPIWGHNSFSYESKNRHILQLCKSPYFVSYQVARKFLIYQSLPFLCSRMVHCKQVLTFCDKILNYKKLVRYNRASDTNCVLLGKPIAYKLLKEDIEKISPVLPSHSLSYCFMYERMFYRKKRYTTAQYGGGKQNNDSFAFLECGQCVKILRIVKFPVCNRVLLFVENVNLSRKPIFKTDFVTFDSIRKVTTTTNKFFVNIEKLNKPCFTIKVNNDHYVSDIPYGCTVE